jgi:integrase
MGVKVIRKSGRKGWFVQVCVGGRRYLRAASSREAAYKARTEIDAALVAGTFVPPKEKYSTEGTTFREAVARWSKEHVNVNLEPSTRRYYENMIDNWLVPAFGDKEVSAIARADIKAAVARWKEERENIPTEEEVRKDQPPLEGKKRRRRKRAIGARSIPNALRTLRSFFSWAIEEELVSSNPVGKPSKIFRVEQPFHGDFLRPEEVPAYLDGLRAKAPRYFALLRTMTFTGLRLGEALGLEWGDIDWNGGFLTVQRARWRDHTTSPKTAGSIRRVNLSVETVKVLEQHRKAIAAQSLVAGRSMSEKVFVNEAGGPADESKVRKAHNLALKVAGLRRIRVHDLRGTFAALLVSAGVPLYTVSKLLGHSDPATTARHYADLAPGAIRETPTILERYVSAASAERNANGMRTMASGKEAPKCNGA